MVGQGGPGAPGCGHGLQRTSHVLDWASVIAPAKPRRETGISQGSSHLGEMQIPAESEAQGGPRNLHF